jgi:seryl-tRNA synthetase
MLDLRSIRADPQAIKAALEKRGDEGLPSLVDAILEADQMRRGAIAEVEGLKARRNEVSKEVGDRKRRGEDAQELIDEMRIVGGRIGELDGEVAESEAEIRSLLMDVPNVPHARVPVGGEESNQVLSLPCVRSTLLSLREQVL